MIHPVQPLDSPQSSNHHQQQYHKQHTEHPQTQLSKAIQPRKSSGTIRRRSMPVAKEFSLDDDPEERSAVVSNAEQGRIRNFAGTSSSSRILKDSSQPLVTLYQQPSRAENSNSSNSRPAEPPRDYYDSTEGSTSGWSFIQPPSLETASEAPEEFAKTKRRSFTLSEFEIDGERSTALSTEGEEVRVYGAETQAEENSEEQGVERGRARDRQNVPPSRRKSPASFAALPPLALVLPAPTTSSLSASPSVSPPFLGSKDRMNVTPPRAQKRGSSFMKASVDVGKMTLGQPRSPSYPKMTDTEEARLSDRAALYRVSLSSDTSAALSPEEAQTALRAERTKEANVILLVHLLVETSVAAVTMTVCICFFHQFSLPLVSSMSLTLLLIGFGSLAQILWGYYTEELGFRFRAGLLAALLVGTVAALACSLSTFPSVKSSIPFGLSFLDMTIAVAGIRALLPSGYLAILKGPSTSFLSSATASRGEMSPARREESQGGRRSVVRRRRGRTDAGVEETGRELSGPAGPPPRESMWVTILHGQRAVAFSSIKYAAMLLGWGLLAYLAVPSLGSLQSSTPTFAPTSKGQTKSQALSLPSSANSTSRYGYFTLWMVVMCLFLISSTAIFCRGRGSTSGSVLSCCWARRQRLSPAAHENIIATPTLTPPHSGPSEKMQTRERIHEETGIYPSYEHSPQQRQAHGSPPLHPDSLPSMPAAASLKKTRIESLPWIFIRSIIAWRTLHYQSTETGSAPPPQSILSTYVSRAHHIRFVAVLLGLGILLISISALLPACNGQGNSNSLSSTNYGCATLPLLGTVLMSGGLALLLYCAMDHRWWLYRASISPSSSYSPSAVSHTAPERFQQRGGRSNRADEETGLRNSSSSSVSSPVLEESSRALMRAVPLAVTLVPWAMAQAQVFTTIIMQSCQMNTYFGDSRVSVASMALISVALHVIVLIASASNNTSLSSSAGRRDLHSTENASQGSSSAAPLSVSPVSRAAARVRQSPAPLASYSRVALGIVSSIIALVVSMLLERSRKKASLTLVRSQCAALSSASPLSPVLESDLSVFLQLIPIALLAYSRITTKSGAMQILKGSVFTTEALKPMAENILIVTYFAGCFLASGLLGSFSTLFSREDLNTSSLDWYFSCLAFFNGFGLLNLYAIYFYDRKIQKQSLQVKYESQKHREAIEQQQHLQLEAGLEDANTPATTPQQEYWVDEDIYPDNLSTTSSQEMEQMLSQFTYTRKNNESELYRPYKAATGPANDLKVDQNVYASDRVGKLSGKMKSKYDEVQDAENTPYSYIFCEKTSTKSSNSRDVVSFKSF